MNILKFEEYLFSSLRRNLALFMSAGRLISQNARNAYNLTNNNLVYNG